MLGPASLDDVPGIKAREMLTDNLFGLVALEALRAGVPGDNVTFGIEHEDGIILGSLHDEAKVLGFSLGRLLVLKELNELAHFRLDHHRQQRLGQQVYRAESVG